MDVRWGAGSPLLLATLLLTGVHCKAESSTVLPQSTHDTSISPAHVSTELSVSNGVTNTVTPPGTLPTPEEPKTKTATGILENTISKHDLDSATTVSWVPTIKTNDSSDSNHTAVAPTNTAGVSSNPNTISINTIISIHTTSDSSLNNSSEHTSGPTEPSPAHSSPTQSGATQSSPTESSPTHSSPTQSVTTQSSPTESDPMESSPTQSSTETMKKVNETGTGSTAQTGNTTSTTITASPSNPLSQETTQLSQTNSSPTGASESKTVSTAQDVTPKDTSTTDATTEHKMELPRALSPGSVAAITIIVILLVLVIFGGATYWKIRHSSYGRLLEDQDYGSLGNYNNPLYDDS